MLIDNQQKSQQHQEDLLRLASFRPFDDTFMRAMFKENLPLAEMILRIILNKEDLILISCSTQADMKRVTGARSICLDAYGTDSTGKKYDIEVQRGDDGAKVRRARYHASVLDIENLDAGSAFDSLPDTYVIFIVEHDVFGYGKPIYKIQRKFEDPDIPFNDGSYIIYVNGEYRGDDPIGKLMHDFSCTNPEEMNYPMIAEITRYLKNNPKGVDEMCKQMEELRQQSRAEGAMETKKGIALNMFSKSYPIRDIAEIAEVSVEQVNIWISHCK